MMKLNGWTAALAAAVCAAQLGAVEVDGLAATVGAETILRSEVRNELRRAGLGEDQFDAMRNSLIDRKLIVKAAGAQKMTLQEWVIENRIREIVENAFGGDRNQLVATLALQKIPYSDWRQRIKDDMIVNAMRWNVVDKYVTATPAEMKAEFAAHPERYRTASKVSVSIETEGEAAPREYVDIKPEDMFLPEICSAIAALPVGASSDWIELGGRRFRFMKTAESGAVARTFAEAYDDIEANVRREKSQAAYAAWVERLRADSYIRIY